MSKVQGHCSDTFQEVQQLFQTYIINGEELGGSLYVAIDGIPVVDIYGGYRDETFTEIWKEDTITNVFSTSKTICALAALTLIDRGIIDVNAKVSKYWPEFAQNGKENIEVRHILSHTSGVSGWEVPMNVSDLYSFDEAARKLAEQKPWWEPGTASGYHSLTFGFLIGELVRRVTGKTLKAFIADELDRGDFQLGARKNDIRRISSIVPAPRTPSAAEPLEADRTSIAFKSFSNPQIQAEMANTPEWRECELGAANGHGNARGIGRMLAPIALGGSFNGTQVLARETIDLIFQEQSYGIDLVTGERIRFGIGYGITGGSRGNFVDSFLPDGRVCFWGGWGGSMAVMDLDRRLTITYVMNRMENVGMGSKRARAYIRAIYRTLGVEFKSA